MPSTLKDVRDSFASADGDGFTKANFINTFGDTPAVYSTPSR